MIHIKLFVKVNDMPNICFLLGGFQGNGGIGRATSVVANAISDIAGYKVTTVSYFQSDKPMLYEISDKVNREYLYTSQISMTKAILKERAVSKLVEIIKNNKIDFLIACGALYYPLAIIAAKKSGVKCYCWEHTNPKVDTDYKFQTVARKIAVKFADKVVVLTKSAEKYYTDTLKIKKEKLEQIYNPVSKSAAVSGKYDENSKRIISVGRLSYPKNFGLLIDVAAEVLSEYNDWSWDIFGTGEEYESLLEKIKSNSLEGKVNLMGQVSDIYERYGAYSFQVMTSRYEGFPMSLIEGAANKLPLISFDIETGPNEIIENGKNGFLIEAENKEQLSNKIKEMISNAEMRKEMSDASFAMNERFTMDSIIKQWDKLFSVE